MCTEEDKLRKCSDVMKKMKQAIVKQKDVSMNVKKWKGHEEGAEARYILKQEV